MLMFASALQAIPNQEGHEAGALVFVGRGVQEDAIWEFFGILRLAFHFRRAFASSKEAEVFKSSWFLVKCRRRYAVSSLLDTAYRIDHTSSKLGDLIHLDLCGPYKVSSSEGFRYFLTVVDDYTRAIWVYLIKSKDENGIAKRKHRHLLNVARPLLIPSYVLNGKSPYEMIYIKTPTPSHLRVFGCLCFATILNNHDKLGSRSEKCVMIGYSNYKKSYRLYSLDRHQFIFLRDVKFFEFVFPSKDSTSKVVVTSNVFQNLNHINFSDIEYPEMPYDDERVNPKLNSDQKSHSDSSHSSMPDRDLNNAYFSDDKFENDIQREIDALLRNDTWETIDLPKDRKSIGSKWIFKIKYKSSGEIDRYKARLVAQGFGQKEGIDYEETFSSVVKMVTVRCLLNVVVSKSWLMFQFDVNNAFLYGDLVETAYMKPPEGQWNAKVTSTLIENGFSQSKSYYSSHTKSDKGVFLAMLVYVDDIIITGNNVYEIENFKAYIKSKFMIKDLGKLKYFLGIEVIDTSEDGGLLFPIVDSLKDGQAPILKERHFVSIPYDSRHARIY
ncbi:ribonuclease H-like domain-containing protein [Tanacetum coccineum]